MKDFVWKAGADEFFAAEHSFYGIFGAGLRCQASEGKDSRSRPGYTGFLVKSGIDRARQEGTDSDFLSGAFQLVIDASGECDYIRLACSIGCHSWTREEACEACGIQDSPLFH